MPNGLKANIQSNKAAILYYTGVFLVAAYNITLRNLGEIIPKDSWWGAMLYGIAEMGLVYFSIIAKFIFGRDADLDRVKDERQQMGVENTNLRIENEGLRVTNAMQNQVMAEAGILSVDYTKPWKSAVKKTDEPDPPELL